MPYRVELGGRIIWGCLPYSFTDAVPCEDPGRPFTILKAHSSFTRFTNFNRCYICS